MIVVNITVIVKAVIYIAVITITVTVITTYELVVIQKEIQILKKTNTCLMFALNNNDECRSKVQYQ